jgi:hypothetical protein
MRIAAAQAADPAGEAVEGEDPARGPGERAQPAPAHEPAHQPQGDHLETEFGPGAKGDGRAAWERRGKDGAIRDVGECDEAAAQGRAVGEDEILAAELLPAPGAGPAAAAPERERLADPGEHGGDDRVAVARAVGGAERDVDGLDALEARGEFGGDRTRQSGRGGGAGDDRDSACAGGMVEGGDADHEVAGVGEVEIGKAGGDAGFGHLGAARVERAGGVDHQVRAVAHKGGGDVAGAVEDCGLGGGEGRGKGGGLGFAAAGDDDRVAGGGEAAGEARAEAAIAADDEDAAHSSRSRSAADGTQQVSRRPNRR